MSKTSRRKYTTEFKSKVCLEAIKEQQTIEPLSKKHDLHPTQINTWKKEFLEKAATVFDKKGSTVTDTACLPKDQVRQPPGDILFRL